MNSFRDLIIGFVLLIIGGFLLFTSIEVYSFRMYGFGLDNKINTTAVLIVFFILAVILLFVKPCWPTKILFIVSILLIILSVIMGIHLRFKRMDLFPLLAMLFCFFGGLVMVVKGFLLNEFGKKKSKNKYE